jgi:glycerate kinase
VATFILDGFVQVQRTDTIVYPSGDGKEYGVAGVLDRTSGEYTRVMVYDDSMGAAAPTP